MQTQISDVLPESVNFVRSAELCRSIEGVISILKLTRLHEALVSQDGDVSVKLSFGDCVGYACLKGEVSATLVTECQRCLKPLELEVSGRFKFGLVHSEDEFELLPEELEPYLIKGDEQSIIELVEDELLLSLPMVAVHETACSEFMETQNKKVQAAVKAERQAEKEASNPFASLKALKGDNVN